MANITFRCGSKSIPSGVDELAVTGLLLPFTPDSVIVSVRQPSASADIITGYVVGTPTADGFSVALSAATRAEGYVLDWTATDGSEQSVESDTLAVSYLDLQKVVAKFLGYDYDNLLDSQRDEIDSYIQSGVRNFYYPPKMEGVDESFEWSFIRQRGAVVTEAGVDTYPLPEGFGRVAGQLEYEGIRKNTVPVIPYGDVYHMLQSNGSRVGAPRFAAVVHEQAFTTRGQSKRLVLFPRPDAAYTLRFTCDSDTGKLDPELRPFPLGGPMFSELVIESCLSVAEQRANDETGIHTENFNKLLVSMISRDRRFSAQEFGAVGDRMRAFGCCADAWAPRYHEDMRIR